MAIAAFASFLDHSGYFPYPDHSGRYLYPHLFLYHLTVVALLFLSGLAETPRLYPYAFFSFHYHLCLVYLIQSEPSYCQPFALVFP